MFILDLLTSFQFCFIHHRSTVLKMCGSQCQCTINISKIIKFLKFLSGKPRKEGDNRMCFSFLGFVLCKYDGGELITHLLCTKRSVKTILTLVTVHSCSKDASFRGSENKCRLVRPPVHPVSALDVCSAQEIFVSASFPNLKSKRTKKKLTL